MKLKLWWKWRKEPQKGPAPLSFVTLVSFNCEFLRPVIESYYSIAQEIVLGLDQDRISFSGNKFDFDDETFRKMIREIDVEGKIRVIEDNFHSFSYPMEIGRASCRERV